jgi:hypothetical protein
MLKGGDCSCFSVVSDKGMIHGQLLVHKRLLESVRRLITFEVSDSAQEITNLRSFHQVPFRSGEPEASPRHRFSAYMSEWSGKIATIFIQRTLGTHPSVTILCYYSLEMGN